MGDQAWLFVPVQDKVQKFLATLSQYPFQEGVNLNPANINYQTLKAAKVMQQVQQLKPAQ